ncbi:MULTISPECIES: PD40 domain-containing protein [unclassified Duganella]|uniref:PD40 domain-containing protein n=1 Tax=unclassified Duganella TaxID=2636909 RepID=UPI000E356BA9|nr:MULTISPECIES: PD40 domain-containing protein [unclassified Duganella]RFP16217.1 hypothetical protein D0T23_10055 [Duganella sp. BJB475]RFP32621.1 hypothetical protein D0T21_10580 [Duganella sp. BJB476]
MKTLMYLSLLVLLGATGAAANAAAVAVKPGVFAPGVISRDAHETAPAFSVDGTTVWFSSSDGTSSTILVSHLVEGRWTTPQVAQFSGRWRDMEPSISPAGDFLIFVSNRPLEHGGKPLDGLFNNKVAVEGGGNLWRVALHGAESGEAVRLEGDVNASASTFAPSIVADGSLYFMRPSRETGRFQLFRSQFNAGRYEAPQALSFSNGEATDVDPAVAPDESFIVFGSGRAPARGIDLFIAYRNCGQWSAPLNLGTDINSAGSDAEPRLSRDHRTLFFSSERRAGVAGASWDNGKYNIWEVPFERFLPATPSTLCDR